MNHRLAFWVVAALLLVPLAGAVLCPESMFPLVKHAIAYPWDVGWLFVYDVVFLVYLWNQSKSSRPIVVVFASAVTFLTILVAYAALHTSFLFGLSLIIPPLWTVVLSIVLVRLGHSGLSKGDVDS
jgi:hypothetical protein